MTTSPPLARRLVAEGLGSFLLFACVIGSGIMATNLSQGNDAIALLGNTLATGAILFVLITVLGPISGAHMNPAVTIVVASRGELSWRDASGYIGAQFAFGILGAWAAHLMFDLPTLQLSVKARTGLGQWVGEGIATFGLILTILGTVRYRTGSVAAAVAGNALEFYALAKYNGIENPSRINTGSKIKIPLTANARSVREKDAQLAQKKQQGTEPQQAAVATDIVASKEEPQTTSVEDDSSEVLAENVPESPATIKAKLADANRAGDFAQSVSLLGILTSQNAEFDASTRLLASEALVGRADMIKANQASTAAQLYTQAADFRLA